MLDFNLLTKTFISTVVILFTAEFLPKVLFQIYSFQFLKFFSLPAYFFYLCFYVISDFILWITNLILKTFFKTQGDKVQLLFSKDELGNYIGKFNSYMGALDLRYGTKLTDNSYNNPPLIETPRFQPNHEQLLEKIMHLEQTLNEQQRENSLRVSGMQKQINWLTTTVYGLPIHVRELLVVLKTVNPSVIPFFMFR